LNLTENIRPEAAMLFPNDQRPMAKGISWFLVMRGK